MSKKDRFQLVGNTIAGTFRVDEVVAEGGFGVVYRAYHMHFRSPVALKCLKIPTELSEDERQSFLEQFRSEAEIQFRLSAALPNIVRPLHVDAVHADSGEFVPIMALEWLDGQSFEKIIEHRTFADMPPMPLSEAMELIGPAAQALHEAHNFQVEGETLSVVHRDIKPDNFFVTEIGGKKTVKLLDFGISKVRRAATQLAGHFSQTSGQAPFSPAYGAPEQWVPKRFGQTGPWTDVWGMALTLVEIIKGDAVIVGDHQAMMGTVLDPSVRPSPRSEGVTVNDEVESVFLKALSVDPRYRYQSIRDFWESLSAALALQGDSDHEETPSGRRVALPRMSAPTPWTPPQQKAQLAAAEAHLPPMLAPAPLEPTPESQQDPLAYPSNPNSDLQPVPPAPSSWNQMEVEIPPIFEPEERESGARSNTERRRTQRVRPSSRPNSPAQIELAPTSSFPLTLDLDDSPAAPAAEAPPPDPGYAPDAYVPPALGGFSLPPSVRSGAPIVPSSPEHETPQQPSTPAPPPSVRPPTANPPRAEAKQSPAPQEAASAVPSSSERRRPPPPRRQSAAGPPPAPSQRAKEPTPPPIPDLEPPQPASPASRREAARAQPVARRESVARRPSDPRREPTGRKPPPARPPPPSPGARQASAPSATRASGHAPVPPKAPPRPAGAHSSDREERGPEDDPPFALTPARRRRGAGSS